jgi:hypothetical protein
LKTIGFIKRILGTKKVKTIADPSAQRIELELRIIEAQVGETKRILVGMSGSLDKIVKGMDSLSKYFELQIKRQAEMDEVESAPPSKADLLY